MSHTKDARLKWVSRKQSEAGRKYCLLKYVAVPGFELTIPLKQYGNQDFAFHGKSESD